ncbi:MAG: matrixin family metalloprotease [Pseudomonadota bacterium]
MLKHFSRRTLTIATLACVTASGVLAFNLTGGKWREGRTTFHVSIPGFAPSGQSWDAAFIDAMNQWTAQTDFTFDVDQTPVDPCAGLGPRSGTSGFPTGNGDARNSAGFRPTVCGSAFGENVLAVTLTLYQSGNVLGFDPIGQTDIIFNSNLSWDTYAGPLRPAREFGRVALHELGHALGLEHESSIRSIMAPFVTEINTLQVDDLAGVSAIYSPPGNCAFSAINLNTSVSNALQNGDCRVMDLFGGNDDPSFLDVYEFSLSEPTYLNIRMQSNELDPVLIITNRALGNQMIFDDFSGGCDARVAEVLPAGDYLLMANTYVVPEKCLGNVGSYTITMTNSTLPPLATVVNTNPNVQVSPLLFSGGASADGVNFRSSFAAQEFVDVNAQLVPDPSQVGQDGSIYVLAILGTGAGTKQYIKNSAGKFVLTDGKVASLVPYRQGPLSALENVSVVEDLMVAGSHLAGQQFRVFVGYATDSAPRDIYYNSVPIYFSIGR